MRISDWSSDVCSSDLLVEAQRARLADLRTGHSAVVPDLVDLAITLHRAGEAPRETGTALLEQLLGLDLYLARQTFDEIAHRFRNPVQPRPRRLQIGTAPGRESGGRIGGISVGA